MNKTHIRRLITGEINVPSFKLIEVASESKDSASLSFQGVKQSGVKKTKLHRPGLEPGT